MKPDFKKMELIPAIMQDYKTKKVLMLAYVNEESYEYMKKNRQTCFYSRSRNELWHKGETSGNYQNIKGMYLDCDRDTLLIYVEQIGNACHTGEYSCFYNEVIKLDENYTKEKNNQIKVENQMDKNNNQMQNQTNVNILYEVYEQIKDRDKNPIENSYTNYLLKCGIDKICKKVGEETTETVIAAKNTNKEELIGEIADLTYHILVLMYNRKVIPEEIKQKLEKRHKKQGNKKIENIKGEY